MVAAKSDERAGQRPVERSRPRWWHRPAGVAVAAAVLVVGSTATANTAGATPRKPTPAEIDVVAAEPADGPVHGEFRVIAADGTVQTRRWQWGQVVAVLAAADPGEPSSITVASEDGYASDYRVDPDQSAGLAIGDVVTVVGLVPAG